jgi:hypothetical protein
MSHLTFLARRRRGRLGGPENGFFTWQEAVMPTLYSAAVEQAMFFTYASLNERQRRLYAANEALKLGHGGIAYVARLFDCHRKTVQRGLAELQNGDSTGTPNQARKKGVADVLVCPSFPDSTKPS